MLLILIAIAILTPQIPATSLNPADVNNLTSICHISCGTCSNSLIDSCLTCSAGFFRLSSDICSFTCPSHYSFLDFNDHDCKACSSSCSLCIESPDNCNACRDGTFYRPDLDACVSECPKEAGYYQSVLERRCIPCRDPNCLDCNEFGECLKCNLASKVDNESGRCMKGDVESLKKDCAYDNCEKCGERSCEICAKGYYQQEGVCEACGTGCRYCVSETDCTACENGFFMKGSSPHRTCQEKSKANKSNSDNDERLSNVDLDADRSRATSEKIRYSTNFKGGGGGHSSGGHSSGGHSSTSSSGRSSTSSSGRSSTSNSGSSHTGTSTSNTHSSSSSGSSSTSSRPSTSSSSSSSRPSASASSSSRPSSTSSSHPSTYSTASASTTRTSSPTSSSSYYPTSSSSYRPSSTSSYSSSRTSASTTTYTTSSVYTSGTVVYTTYYTQNGYPGYGPGYNNNSYYNSGSSGFWSFFTFLIFLCFICCCCCFLIPFVMKANSGDGGNNNTFEMTDRLNQ